VVSVAAFGPRGREFDARSLLSPAAFPVAR